MGLGKAGLRRIQDKALSLPFLAWKRVDAGSEPRELGAQVMWVQGHLGESVPEKSSVDSSIGTTPGWRNPWTGQLEGWESFTKLGFWCPVLVSLSQCVHLASV